MAGLNIGSVTIASNGDASGDGLAKELYDVLVAITPIPATSAPGAQQQTADLIRAMNVFHGRPDLTNIVEHWDKPFIVMCGDSGQLESVEKATALAVSAPNGELHVMRGCGHYMNMERPVEFNAVLENLVQLVCAE